MPGCAQTDMAMLQKPATSFMTSKYNHIECFLKELIYWRLSDQSLLSILRNHVGTVFQRSYTILNFETKQECNMCYIVCIKSKIGTRHSWPLSVLGYLPKICFNNSGVWMQAFLVA
jgi:hypothetical protein